MHSDIRFDWKAVIDAMDMPVSVHDRDHIVRLANQAFLDAVNKTMDEVIGARCHKLAHCSDEPLLDCPHKELLRSGKPVEREITAPDGIKVVGISCYPLSDEDGVLQGSVHIVRDVTGVARLRERMERSNRMVAAHVSVLRDHLRSFNDPGAGTPVPFENPGIEACYDIRDCRETSCPARLQQGLRCWHAPSTRCERDGLVDAVDRLAFCHGCEVYARATPDDLTALTEMFNDLVYLLREKQLQLLRSERLLVLGELSATLAHELRSPLNSLSISTQRFGRWLRSGEMPRIDDLWAFQEGMSGDVHRLDEVIDRFIRSVKRPLRPPAPVTLAAVLEEATGQVRDQAERQGTLLELGCDDPNLLLPGDLSEHMGIVALNMMLNAVEATGEGDRIALGCTTSPAEIVLAVTDTGYGIPEDVLPRIFEPFFSTKPHGTGLGLAIISWIVRRHEGRVSVSSEPGRGTTFTVRFPHRSQPSGEPSSN